MDTNTSPTKSSSFLVYVKNTDESDNELDFLGIFPTWREAMEFRKQFLIDNYDLDVEDPDNETEVLEAFEEYFNGKPEDVYLEDGHCQYLIDEVPVYGK